MNIKKIHEAFNKHILDKQPENEYTPPQFVCVSRTVYPEGKPRIRKNGQEWYGLVEDKATV